jgi:hypothetical protein
MNPARPRFHPISASDVSDEELAQFAQSQGVGTLVKPPAQTPPVAPQTAPDASNDAPGAAPTAPSPAKRAKAKTTVLQPGKPDTDLKLSVMVPRYVGKALRLRAADEDCTVRHLVLQGLQAIGIPVKDADLNPDGRLYRKDAR